VPWDLRQPRDGTEDRIEHRRGATALASPPEPIGAKRADRAPRLGRRADPVQPLPRESSDPTGPLARIDRMSPEECLRAYRAGRLTRAERTAWAAAYPDEVPTVDGEPKWVALRLADLVD
jgi:hypothetical protein